MNSQMLTYLMIGVGVLFALIVIAFFILKKRDKDTKYIQQLQQGTKTSKFSSEIIYKKILNESKKKTRNYKHR